LIYINNFFIQKKKKKKKKKNYNASWKPEYGKYMIEGTPNQPYGSTINDLLTVENNMKERYCNYYYFN